jgi:hypothetical protein
MSQELLQNTLYLTNSGDVELKHEAIQLLDLIFERKWTSLGIDEKDQVIRNVVDYVNSHPLDCTALQCLYRTFSHDNEKSLYFSIKILSSLFKLDPQHLTLFLDMLLKNNIKLSSIINEALKVPKLFNITNELVHFAGLILTSQQPVALSYLAHDDLVNNLQIPKMFEF